MKKEISVILYTNRNTEESVCVCGSDSVGWKAINGHALNFDIMSQTHAMINGDGIDSDLIQAVKLLVDMEGVSFPAPNK